MTEIIALDDDGHIFHQAKYRQRCATSIPANQLLIVLVMDACVASIARFGVL